MFDHFLTSCMNEVNPVPKVLGIQESAKGAPFSGSENQSGLVG